MQQPTVAHIIKTNERVILELLDAEWYDTATPYQGCLRALKELYALAATTELMITSDGVTYLIQNQAEFMRWVAEIFERDQRLGFTRIGTI